jgi:molybdenum cofactor cytidylyltransferase
MIFASLSLAEAEGGVAAHSIRLPDHKIKKGQMISAQDIEKLAEHGMTHVMTARLEHDDVGEDQAAEQLASCLTGAGIRREGPATGRSNLFAACHGLLRVEPAQIDAVNMVSEAITVATLPNWRVVEEGEMVATVKIIPFAVPQKPLAECCQLVAAQPPLHIAPFKPKRVGLIATTLPGLKSGVVRKTAEVLQKRLAVGGSALVANRLVRHDEEAVRSAICAMGPMVDLLIVFGASAMTDRRDVVPMALEQAGGQIIHFGMPVDPGNLLLLGAWFDEHKRAVPVIGAPGCARSPKENGFDWILQRLMADIAVTRDDIMRMGHGGLLMDVVHRGLPRAAIGVDP